MSSATPICRRRGDFCWTVHTLIRLSHWLYIIESRTMPTSESQDNLDSGYLELSHDGSIHKPCKTAWFWRFPTVKVRHCKLMESAHRPGVSVGTRDSTENPDICIARLRYRRNKYNHLENEFQGVLKRGLGLIYWQMFWIITTHGHICSISLCEVITMSHNWRTNEDTVHQEFDDNMR